ncbi:MAG: hypothetical protein ACRD16_12735 [Thermoanaerobaculia bacterium]
MPAAKKNPHAVALGRSGGSRTSDAKRRAARANILRRWARYRSAQADAEKKGEAMLKNSEVSRRDDGRWQAKYRTFGQKVRKADFRTRREARQWLRGETAAFVAAERAKALAALPARDKTIAAAFERMADAEPGRRAGRTRKGS